MSDRTQPNILLFCTDQHHAGHLGCMGHPIVKTPNIDRIASEGALFRNCYSSSPACMPARATMVTGLTNRASGCRTNGVALPEDIPTLPGVLAEAGYRTHSVGKLHLKQWPVCRYFDISEVETPEENSERRMHWDKGEITKSPDDYYGFQTQDSVIGHVDYSNGDYKTWLDANHPGAYELYRNSNPETIAIPPELHYNNWIADRTIDFLRERKQEQPFFLWCSFPDPHSPFAAVEKWVDFYKDADIELPETAIEIPLGGKSETMTTLEQGLKPCDPKRLIECHRQTYAMISHVDEQVGRVLDQLETLGIAENTVVGFIADHGEQLGEHGMMHKGIFPYDGHARIPFLCKAPGMKEKGLVIDDVVSQLDLVPTMLDLANVPQADDPMINEAFRSAAAPLPPPLPGESLKPVLLNGERPERQDALIEFDTEIFRHGQGNPYDLLQMRTLVTNEFKLVYYSPSDEILLFDRKNDPNETRNLAKDSNFTHIREKLLVRMIREISRTEQRLPRRFTGH